MTFRTALTVAAATTLLTISACNNGDDDSADTASSTSPAESSTETTSTIPPTTTSSSTSTSSTSTSTTATSATPPPTIAEGDWEAILEELARRRVALYAAPDLARIGDYCAPGSECAASLETQLGDAISKGQHIEGQRPFDVIAIEQALVGEQDPGAPPVASVIFVVAPTTPPPARLVDAAGNVVDELALTTTNTRGAFTLVSWDSDPTLPWRVVLAEDLGPAP
jgi:hypothetical protein